MNEKNRQPIDMWFNRILPEVVGKLEKSILEDFSIASHEGLDLAGRNEIYTVLDDILAALFPGCYGRESVALGDMNFYLGDILRHISFKLGKHIRESFKYRCLKRNCDNCTCQSKAEESLMAFIESLPAIRAVLLEDIKAAYDGDPAATSLDEIVLSYPCVEAIATHRIAHKLYRLDVPIIPRIMSERAHSRTGIDIHPGATIGPRFFIDHGTGVVIGETCTIGRNVKVYQGVTLGATSPFDKEGSPARGVKRHPDIEDDVIIYANATILGGKTVIGKAAIIGANTWITSSVEPGAVIGRKSKAGS
ncbi:MAG: serine O-acetyltransferase EpsC [Chitinivibrionales bacterium]